MKKILLIVSAISATIASHSALASDDEHNFRPLSEKGSKIVASRTYKGQEINQQMLLRVNKVDAAYRAHIDLYKGMKSCKKATETITTLTPNSKIDSKYTLTPKRKSKGKGAPDTCMFDMETMTKTTSWVVSCELSMKEANTVADEALSAYSDAISRFREDGLYSNISPSAELTKLQQSDSCKMEINASSFK